MKKNILHFIRSSKANGRKRIAILLDPDKIELKDCQALTTQLNNSNIDLIFVGGSSVAMHATETFLKNTNFKKPVILFPGSTDQITDEADGLLFLSLLSGDNPEYLIHQQIKAAPLLQKTSLEIIPTGYILIDGGNQTAVQRVSQTKPIAQTNLSKIKATALAGVYMGKQLLYLEAGSGAQRPVQPKIISEIRNAVDIPIIVGGGIRSKEGIAAAFSAGADIVVIGTAFENNPDILEAF